MQRKYVDYNKDMIPSFPDAFGLTDININNFFAKTPYVISNLFFKLIFIFLFSYSDGFPKLQNITFQSFQMEANEENVMCLYFILTFHIKFRKTFF